MGTIFQRLLQKINIFFRSLKFQICKQKKCYEILREIKEI
jgi:hypothetical protein